MLPPSQGEVQEKRNPDDTSTVAVCLQNCVQCVRAMLVGAHDPPCSSISVAGEVCCWIWWAVPEILSSAAPLKLDKDADLGDRGWGQIP